jgi:hypothetical protein
MKKFTLFAALIICSRTLTAQYYYKDIILTHEAKDRWKAYRDDHVSAVKLLSFEADDQPTAGFVCDQTIGHGYSEISTHSQSDQTGESYLFSYYDASGMLKKTVDSSERFHGTTLYTVDANGTVIALMNTSAQADNQVFETERHEWKYNDHGYPVSMIKLKNIADTTFVRFITDEKGNVVEEHATRKNQELPVIYYYYDPNGRLTDIVRFNLKANRLLPDYIFEYDNNGRLSSMLTVPEDSNGYQKWIYEYNEKGLRWKETCLNKQKQVLGKIEYQYSFKN